MLIAMVMLTPCSANAQGDTPMPLAQAIVSDEKAQVTLTKVQINDRVARQLVDAGVECARNIEGGGHLAFFVLAPNGYIVHAHVMDGVVPIGVEAAHLKAKTALFARMTTRAVADRFPTVETRLFRTDLGREGGLAYFFAEGGFPIVLEGNLIGALGVGGGPVAWELECAVAAFNSLGLELP
jgi:uncharacterized protein GlcG (DUF336 family)